MRTKRCQPLRLFTLLCVPVKITTALLAVCILCFSCQKKYLGPDSISYGTLFEHLQRMVISNGSGVTTHTFTYDGAGQVTTHTILFKAKGSAATTNSVEQYYRSASNVDSIKVTISVNGTVSAIRKLYFSYGSGSNVDQSVILSNINDPLCTRDSSVYQYSGSFLIERTDYVTTGTTPYNSTPDRDLVYQYSGSNISNLIFNNNLNSAGKTTTLVSYNYDTAKAALPVNGFQYGYDSVCFANHIYAAVNNLASVKYGEGSSSEGATYSYTYVIQGKPIKATRKEIFANGDALESSIEFFYD